MTPAAWMMIAVGAVALGLFVCVMIVAVSIWDELTDDDDEG